MRWRALGVADRLERAAAQPAPARRAPARRRGGGRRRRRAGHRRCSEWLARTRPDRRGCCDWLWNPLAIAALNQSPDVAAARAVRPRARRAVRSAARRRGDWAAGGAARRALRRAGASGSSRTPAAGVLTQSAGAYRPRRSRHHRGVAAGDTTIAARRGRQQRAVARVRATLGRRRAGSAGGDRRQRGGDGQLADRDRQSLARRPDHVGAVHRPRRRTDALGLQQARALRRRHRAPLDRRRAAPSSWPPETTTRLPRRPWQQLQPRVAGRRGAAASRDRSWCASIARRSRSRRAPAAAGDRSRRCPASILAGDWTDTGLPGTIEGAVLSGHRARPTRSCRTVNGSR